MSTLAIDKSANLLEMIADMLRNGEHLDEQILDNVKEQILTSQESLRTFIMKSNFKIIGKNLGRSRSSYIKDSSSYKRVFEMLNSQVNYVNSILKSDPSKKVVIIAPIRLGGTDNLTILRNSIEMPTLEEQNEWGVHSSEEWSEHDWITRPQYWISQRLYDSTRVRFIDGNRQLFKESSIKDQIVQAVSDNYTNFCFFFKPVRNNRRFKHECGSLKKKYKKYSEVELAWITWIMNIVHTHSTTPSSEIEFTFSRDYSQIVNKISEEYSCVAESLEFLTDSEKLSFVENRIDHAINIEHQNKNDECFHNLVNYCKSELSEGRRTVTCTIEDLMKIMNYSIDKPSNVEYKLNKQVYNDIFDIKCIDCTGRSRQHRYEISFANRFFEIQKPLTSKKSQQFSKETTKTSHKEILSKNLSLYHNAPNFVDESYFVTLIRRIKKITESKIYNKLIEFFNTNTYNSNLNISYSEFINNYGDTYRLSNDYNSFNNQIIELKELYSQINNCNNNFLQRILKRSDVLIKNSSELGEICIS